MENAGQANDDAVRYYTSTSMGSIGFLDSGIVITQRTEERGPRPLAVGMDPSSPMTGREMLSPIGIGPITLTITYDFIDANDVTPQGTSASPGEYNYLLGSDPSSWVIGVTAFKAVIYQGLYEGIDLIYTIKGGQLKYDVVVHPGADPGQFRVSAKGHDSMAVTEGGDLVVTTSFGDLVDGGLVAFYGDDPTDTIDCRFVLEGTETYSFELAPYDTSREVVIDPLVYSSYLGGQLYEEAEGMTVDKEGNIYICGWSSSSRFPVTPTSYQDEQNGSFDAFLCKFTPDLTKLRYATFVGGDAFEFCSAVHVTDDGRAYLIGRTHSDEWPTSPSAFQTWNKGEGDLFIFELNEKGNGMLHSTLIGGIGRDHPEEIVVGDDGSIFAVGLTQSADFPTTSDAMYSIDRTSWQGFILKLKADMTSVTYASALSDAGDVARALTMDEQGNVLVTGSADRDEFPTVTGAGITWGTGDYPDAFIAKYAPDIKTHIYTSFIGGSGSEGSNDIVVDGAGYIYIAGWTRSDDLNPGSGVLETYGGDLDGMFAKLAPDGSSIVFACYLGGSGWDQLYGIDVDSQGRIHTVGISRSSDFPLSEGAHQEEHAGGRYDIVASIIDPEGTSLDYSTYIGGSNDDLSYSVVADLYGNTVLCGYTESDDFPVTEDAFQDYPKEYDEAVLCKVSSDITPPIADAGPDLVVDTNQTFQLNGTASTDDQGILKWLWEVDLGWKVLDLEGPTPELSIDEYGNYAVTLTVVDSVGLESTALSTVRVQDITPPVADAGGNYSVDQHDVLTFDGRGSSDNVGVFDWKWSFRDNGTDITLVGPTPDYIFHGLRNVSVTLSAIDANGNVGTDTVNVTVVDSEPPVAIVGKDQKVEPGAMVLLDGSASSDNGEIVQWLWRIESKKFLFKEEGELLYHGFNDTGDYNVTLTVVDSAGNRDSMSYRVLVKEPDEGGVPAPGAVAATTAILLVMVLLVIPRRRERAGPQ